MCSAPHNHTFTRYQWSVIITNNICFSLVRGNTFNGDSGYLFSSMYSTLWDDCAVQTQWKGTRKESCAPPWRSNPWKRLQRYRFSCYPWKKKREARKKKYQNVDDVFFFEGFFSSDFSFRFSQSAMNRIVWQRTSVHMWQYQTERQVELTVGGGQFGDCRCIANLKRAIVSVSSWASSGHVLSDPVKCRTYFRFKVTYLVHKLLPNISGDSDW